MGARVEFSLRGRRWRVDLQEPTRLSIRLDFDGDQPCAFGLDRARAEAVETDDFVGDTSRGGSVNCDRLHLTPHANGTHTETAGHLLDENLPVGSVLEAPLLAAVLVTVSSRRLDETSDGYAGRSEPGDRVLTRRSLAAAGRGSSPVGASALIVRTDPNSPDKRRRDWSGTNPPYPTDQAVEWLREQGVEHVAVDLPSFDREQDGGATPNHRRFWGLCGSPSQLSTEAASRTITEMIHVPDQLPDGRYALQIQVPDFALDAAPSRLLLYGAAPVE